MKFSIITHAVHKVKDSGIYAYEPYVREMNLWLKYVGAVKIVAPISSDAVSSIESKYQFNGCHCEHRREISSKKRHPQLDWGSHEKEQQVKSLRQACTELSRSAQTDISKEQLQNQVQQDETECHPEPVEGSHDLESNKQIPNQVGNDGIKLIPIPSFDVTSLKNGIKAIFRIPKILIQIYKAMQWADHIHLRCPGNIGLLGCFVQILFPKKSKTVKYAGNWDPTSKQPLSYKLQKCILSNTFLTRNTKVLVYGEWPNQSKNIVPFFTASYSEKECYPDSKSFPQLDKDHKVKSLRQAQTDICDEQIPTLQTPSNDETDCHPEFISGSHDSEDDKQIPDQVQHDDTVRHPLQDETNRHPEPVEGCDEIAQNSKSLRQACTELGRSAQTDKEKDKQLPNQIGNDGKIYFLFVGALTKGKQPLLSVQVIHQLKLKGYRVQLDIYGEGKERENIANYILDNSLENEVSIHGNVAKEIVKSAYQNSHFLLFISKSEGWPKVVAEAMFWGCLPITTAVSCIPYMLANGTRGTIVNANVDEIMVVVEAYLKDIEKYTVQAQKAIEWSRQYTLERFEKEIGKLLKPSFPT